MKTKKPSDWKFCATCVHWIGRQTPDYFLQWVEYDSDEKARCAGGGFNNVTKSPENTCSKWVQRFKR